MVQKKNRRLKSSWRAAMHTSAKDNIFSGSRTGYLDRHHKFMIIFKVIPLVVNPAGGVV